MIYTSDTPSPPYVVMRKNGENTIIPFADETPSPPYLAAMLGGKTRYAPLVSASSADNAAFILRANDLLTPAQIPISHDYGEGTVNLSAYFHTDLQYPSAMYPAVQYPYEAEVRVSYVEGQLFDDDDNPLTPLPISKWPVYWNSVTWELSASSEILLTDENQKDVICTSRASPRYIVGRYHYDPWGISDDNDVFSTDFPADTAVLIHHSECKVDNPAPEIAAKKGKWEIAKIISSNISFAGDDSPLYGIGECYEIKLDRVPDIDLENFHVQIVPFIDLQALTVCTGLTIKPEPYGEDSKGARHGGIVALRCCGSTASSPESGSYGDYRRAVAIEFMGGYIDMRNANLPDGNDGVFIFAPSCTVYDSKYENQPAPYNNYILT